MAAPRKDVAVVYVGPEESVQLLPYGRYPGGDVVACDQTFTTTAEHAAGLLESSNWQPASAAANPRRSRR